MGISVKHLVVLAMLLPVPCRAAEFVSVNKVVDTWIYEIDITRHGKKEHMTVIAYDCNTPLSRITGKPLMDKPTVCFANEADARKEMLRQAAQLEGRR